MSNGVKDRGKGQGHAAEAIFDARTRPIVVVKFCQLLIVRVSWSSSGWLCVSIGAWHF